MAQAGLVSVIVGAGAAWFGLYVNSGKSDQKIVVQTSSNTKGTESSFSGEATPKSRY